VKRLCVLAALAMGLAPSSEAHALDVPLEPQELALELNTSWGLGAAYAHPIDDFLLTLGATASFAAEGFGLQLGLRPTLAVADDYRLVWASEVGPVLYLRDGPSVGGRATTQLQNVLRASPVLLLASPKVDLVAAGGALEGWRLGLSLSLGVGLELDPVAVWLTGELGYALGGVGPGVFVAEAAFVLAFRFDRARPELHRSTTPRRRCARRRPSPR